MPCVCQGAKGQKLELFHDRSYRERRRCLFTQTGPHLLEEHKERTMPERLAVKPTLHRLPCYQEQARAEASPGHHVAQACLNIRRKITAFHGAVDVSPEDPSPL